MSIKKHLVIFTPSGKRGHFQDGTSVLSAARHLGVDLNSICGGRGICSKCQITPIYGTHSKHGIDVQPDALSLWNATEQRYYEKRGLIEGRRLGCQATITGDVVIDIPPESQTHKQVIRKRAESRDITLDPLIRLFYVEVDQPDMHNPSGDFERLCTALQRTHNLTTPRIPLDLLQNLQSVLRQGDWKISCAIRENPHKPHDILHLWPGYAEPSLYGVAVDLGSTTLAAHLCDLQSGDVVASAGIMNPQIRFGEDLMSRVSYAMMNTNGTQEMTQAVRGALDQLFNDIAHQASIPAETIMDMVLVCNPVMHHLLLGIDPYELGQAPFALATSSALDLPVKDLDLSLHPHAQCHILPCIAGHVGADAAAVILSEAPEKSTDLMLIVDVGTNAEIILGDHKKILACSSPTGPAFEGAQISAGQRAAPGAIEHVRIDPKTKEPRFQVIGSEYWSNDVNFIKSLDKIKITGICGSGIIEAVAEMRLAGIVDPSGLIGSPDQTGSPRCFADGRTFSYLLHKGEGEQQDIVINNRDIREIQMAKAALYAGTKLLIDKMDGNLPQRVILAGAFGAHISPLHAMILGMIPDCELRNVTSAGNAAGTGARIALLNRQARQEITQLVQRIEKIETAIEPRFQEHFVNASAIPNSIDPFPILQEKVDLPNVLFNSGGNDSTQSRRRKRSPRR